MPLTALVSPIVDAEPVDLDVRSRGALRFITCGSVDDGKSTLIGRLLYEAHAIFEDQEAALESDSKKFGTTGDEIDYALLVDGLEAEREQGITIDVAYRFFSTPRRAFIVADTPGHQQYTRNMATGASGADLAILLIDARQGVLEQTRRHAAIVGLLGIRHVVLAINKMDLVDYSESVFDAIVAQFKPLGDALEFSDVTPIPLSARKGDNVVALSPRMPWYKGPALLPHLEQAKIDGDDLTKPFRFPVQWVIRPNSEFRGVAGTIASGRVSVGDVIAVASSGRQAAVARIVTMDGDLETAVEGQAITLVFSDHVDIGRGDILCDPKRRPDVARTFSAQVVWMSADALTPGARFLLKAGTRTVSARVASIEYQSDIATLERKPAERLALNDIGLVHIETIVPIPFDSYADNRATGAFILIHAASNETVAAAMIVAAIGAARETHPHASNVDAAARENLNNQKAQTVWLTGLSGSGKSTIANLVERKLHAEGFHTMLLDGDNLRKGLNSDLGFSPEARAENVRRTGEVARLMMDAGLIVICALVSPFREDRAKVAAMFPEDRFVEVFIDAPLEVCRARDPKGLYVKAADGKIADMTGVGQVYERPVSPALTLETADMTAEQAAEKLVVFLKERLSLASASSLDSSQL